jgi:predicted rRNA methylase YqxC with S4 and FtsJ domains
VRVETAHAEAVEIVRAKLLELGCGRTEIMESPILGGEGNQEFLLYGVF